MKIFILSLLFLLSTLAHADTPPPGTVKAKMFSGDGATSFSATGTALNVNVTNASGLTTVNQGTAGVDPWLFHFNNSTIGVTGTFWQATQPVSGTFWQSVQPVSGTVTANAGTGTMLVDGSAHTQPVSGTFWQATQPVSGTFWQATQPVSIATLPALSAGAATIGNVNINGTVPVSGTVTATNASIGATGSAVPASAAQVGGVDGSGNLRALQVSNAGVLSVDASGATVPVSGTFWQATQPVSGTVTANAGTGTFIVDASGHTVPVSGTFWQATQPVSAAALPLPAGASTSAKQPALGAAGTASSDVITVQGIASMTPLLVNASGFTVPVSGTFWQATQPVSGTVTANAGTGTMLVDGSAHTQPVSGTFWQATQPVSGTVTANVGTTNGLALDATVSALEVAQNSTTSGQSGALVQGAVTTAAPTYTTAKTSPLSLTTAGALRIDGSASTQPVSGTVTANAGSGTFAVSGTFWQATQPVSIATAPVLVAGSAIIGKVGIDQTTPGTTNGVQVNAALPAGSNVIGHVIIDTAPTTAVTQSGNWNLQYNSVNSAASQTTGTVSTVITLSAPSNAIGFILEAKDSNTANIRWAMGATATTTVGQQLQPGRDTGYVPAGVSVSVVSESGTQEYQIQWVSTH